VPKPVRISAHEVIDRILDLIQALPQAAKDLPAACRTRGYWKKLFGRNDRTRRLLELFRELPAFTNQAPKPGDARGWAGVMRHSFAGPPAALPNQASDILRRVLTAAKRLPPGPRGPRWRDRFGPKEVIQRVRPAESNDYIPNPHRGTTTFQRFQGDDTYAAWFTSDIHGPIEFNPGAPVRDNVKYIPRTTLSYCRWPWRALEPGKGKYNWRLVDMSLKCARKHGQTLQLRFQPFTRRIDFSIEPPKSRRHPPNVSVDVPEWYWDTGARWLVRGPSAVNEPDSNDPRYVKHFGDFIRAFARRYDGHPDLESVDIAYAGIWGESGGNTTAASAAKLVDIYLRSFKKTVLLSMLGTHGCKYAETKTRGAARHAGWRADCIGDLRKRYGAPVPPELCFNHTFDAYPMQIQQDGVKDAWMDKPVTMETCGNVATWFMENSDLDVVIREGYRYHMSVFMPKSVFFPQEFLDRLIEFDRKIGYRFVVRQMTLPLECRSAQRIRLQFFIDNVGCAPIYRPYRLAVRFRQGRASKVVRLKNDIRKWMPGHTWFEERITVPGGLRKGEVKIDLGIVDETDRPRVWFAVKGQTPDGWHPMTSMDVV